MNKLLSLLLLTTSIHTASAESIYIPTAKEYLSGRAFCDSFGVQIQHENGFYTQAPIDYQNPTAGHFEIYSWFQDGFDANRPTVVYFTGGPGQGTHWGQGALTGNYNLLMVDQRGIACSRPLTYKDYLNPDFYSSKNVALDLEEIRKSLNINKWSVYGVSYGSIPATIYGSMFPERTRSVILEGVAFNAESLWKHNRRREIITEMIESQEVNVVSKLKSIASFGVDPVWFFTWAKDQLLMNAGRKELHYQLGRLSDEKEFEDFVDMLKSNYGPQEPTPRNELYVLNEVPYFMLTCQEMGALNFNSEITWGENGEIVESQNKDIVNNCAKLNAKPKTLYTAENFPLVVPTFYFQGENDPATEIQGSIDHYRIVARGMKQFFLLSEGGHNPNLEILRQDNVGQQEMMFNTLTGNITTEELIELTNSELTDVRWNLR